MRIQNVSQFFFSKFRYLTICLAALLITAVLQFASYSQVPFQAVQLSPIQNTRSHLNTVLERGQLICGVEGTIPGWSFVDSSGQYSGLDADICRAVAAAVFATSTDIDSKIQYRNLDSAERFSAIASGAVDLLSRNTSWTAYRDSPNGSGLEFAPPTFIDGQSMMVRRNSSISRVQNLQGKSVCVEVGTTTELNLETLINSAGISADIVKFQDGNSAFAAYREGRCDAITSDRSQLAAYRVTSFDNPGEHLVWDTLFTIEPLAPATAENDTQWSNLVRWVVYGLIQAEVYGITQDNVAIQLNSENPMIRFFLGREGDFGQILLGLSNNFMVDVIRAVGNYGEIYQRNVGSQSLINIPRGANNLWSQGGLMYSPPWR
jgi:general L-amino acid transport system substrate-binding protein